MDAGSVNEHPCTLMWVTLESLRIISQSSEVYLSCQYLLNSWYISGMMRVTAVKETQGAIITYFVCSYSNHICLYDKFVLSRTVQEAMRDATVNQTQALLSC